MPKSIWTRLFRTKSRPAAQRPRTRLGLEALEAREVPAVFAFPASGQVVVGTTASTDTVTIDHQLINNKPFTVVNGIVFADGSITNGIHIQSGFRTVNILATSKDVTFDGGALNVNVGKNGDMSGIAAEVDLGASTAVTLDDSKNPIGLDLGGDVTVDDTGGQTTVLFMGGVNLIKIDDVSGIPGLGGTTLGFLTLKGGLGNITFDVQNTPNPFGAGVTTIDTGAGNDTINVHGTSSNFLDIESTAGTDQINIETLNGSLQDIQGNVTVNTNPGTGTANVSVDGSANSGARNVLLSPSGLFPNSTKLTGMLPGGFGLVTSNARTDSLTVRLGNGESTGNTVRVDSTPSGGTTEIDAGVSNDTINVEKTQGVLNLNSLGGADTVNITNHGSLQGIQGAIHLFNSPNYNTVNIDESADNRNHTFEFYRTPEGQGVIDGLGVVAPIFYNPPDIHSITLTGGQGQEEFGVESTLGGFPITINAPGSVATFIAGFSTGSLDDIHNPLTFNGGAGFDALLIADQNAAHGHFYFNNGSQFTRDDGVTINYSLMNTVQILQSPLPPPPFNPDPFFPAATNLALTGSIRAGQSATLTGQLTDGDTNQVLSLTVNWGDGSPVSQSTPNRAPFDVSHEYDAPGTYIVIATWTDQLGRHNAREMKVTVAPAEHHHHGHHNGDHDDHDADGNNR
jgi:hypothetical protein